MITDRFLEESDLDLLELSLAKDETHKGTDVGFFVKEGCLTKVYEDERGPILFARVTKALRLDIQYVSNSDVKRNIRAMLEGFGTLAEKAKENGFTEIIFNTDSLLLSKFCRKYFNFTESNGELRRLLT